MLSIEDAFKALEESCGRRMKLDRDAARAYGLAVLEAARPQGMTHICDMEDCDECNGRADELRDRIEKLGS